MTNKTNQTVIMHQFLTDLNYLKGFHDFLVDFYDCVWQVKQGEVSWNTDDNQKDLDYGDGNTYSCEIDGERTVIGDYVVMNLDDGCGNTVTAVFLAEKEVV